MWQSHPLQKTGNDAVSTVCRGGASSHGWITVHLASGWLTMSKITNEDLKSILALCHMGTKGKVNGYRKTTTNTISSVSRALSPWGCNGQWLCISPLVSSELPFPDMVGADQSQALQYRSFVPPCSQMAYPSVEFSLLSLGPILLKTNWYW